MTSLRVRALIQRSDRRVIARIDFDDTGVFVNELRFVVAHPVDLVRDLLEVRLPNDNPHRFLAA